MILSPHLQIQNNIDFFLARFVLFLTCVSDKLRCFASSLRSAPTTYWFFSKACSNFNSWLGLKAVRILFGLRKGSKNSGKWGPGKRNIDTQLERYVQLISPAQNQLDFFLCINISLFRSSFARIFNSFPQTKENSYSI